MHDLYSTELTQETRPADNADFASPTRQHVLDHVDLESICLGDLGHELYREWMTQMICPSCERVVRTKASF